MTLSHHRIKIPDISGILYLKKHGTTSLWLCRFLMFYAHRPLVIVNWSKPIMNAYRVPENLVFKIEQENDDGFKSLHLSKTKRPMGYYFTNSKD